MNVMEMLQSTLSPADLAYILQNIAEATRDGIFEQQYPRSLYVPVIQFVLTFKTLFSLETAQDDFVQSFLETVLQGISEKTFRWLNKQAKKWPAEQAAAWKHYRFVISLPASDWEKSWWERLLAFILSL